MNYELQADIFCHDLTNPPAHDRSCNIDLQLTKSEGLIDFEGKRTTSSETIYSIKISNLQEIGFTNTQQTTIQYEYRNLILACNGYAKKLNKPILVPGQLGFFEVNESIKDFSYVAPI